MAIRKTYTQAQITERLSSLIEQLNDIKHEITGLDTWQAPYTDGELEAFIEGAEAGDGLIVKSAIAALKASITSFTAGDAGFNPFRGF